VFGLSGKTVVLAVAALLALESYYSIDSVAIQIVYASLALTLLGLAAALHMTRGQRLLDSLAAGQLGPWFGASFAVVFGLASLTWIAPPAPYGSIISKENVLRAMVVVAVALTCFTIGYAVVPKRPVHSGGRWLRRVIVTERPVRPGQRTAWLLFGFALAAYLGQIAIGRFGYLSNPAAALTAGNPFAQGLFVVGNFSVFAVALAANDYARSRGSRRLASFALLLAGHSIVGAFSGNKEIIALGLIAALFGYAAAARRLPIAGLAVAACIFIFVVVPFITSFRAQIAMGDTRLSPIQVIQTVSQRGLGFFIPAQGQAPATQTLERVSRIGDVAIVVQRSTPTDLAYRPATELLQAPLLGLVPRLIWPDKPILATGYEFSRDYYGFPPTQYSASAVTPEGDFWRHGGWLVLIVGMLLFGAAVRVLDVLAEDVRKSPLRLMSILTFFPLIVTHETDAVLLLASIPSLFIGIAVAARIVTVRRGTRRLPADAIRNLVVVVNQPIQHFSPSFRSAAQSPRIRLSVLYWTQNSAGMFDTEFDRHVTWDADLMSGYRSVNAEGANGFAKAWNTVRSLRDLKPDMVVCFGWASPAARLAILWSIATGTPFYFYGDTSWRQSSRGPRQWLRRLLLTIVFRFATGALSTGTFNREFYIVQGMNPRRIVESVYPIDVSSYAAARQPGIGGSSVVIGFAGKLIVRKGVDELLRALALIADDVTWQARIIGEGEERARLESQATALGIGNRVDFVGFHNVSEMPSELARCDIVVLPSRHDNRGMIAAEAMAAGAVVIVSSHTGVWGPGDLVEDGVTGRVYRSGDPSELAAIMRQLLDPEARASLRRQGAMRAADHGPDAFTGALERAAVKIGTND